MYVALKETDNAHYKHTDILYSYTEIHTDQAAQATANNYNN